MDPETIAYIVVAVLIVIKEPAIKSPLLSLFRKRITQGVTLK
ncbi:MULTISPECIES: hypothetical protein [unclassified Marinomonas]|nr:MULTISPECIES: hypothetical protein [unclassified Marinomonas]